MGYALCVWWISLLFAVFHAAGVMAQDDYDYIRRCKNWHGWKFIAWAIVNYGCGTYMGVY